MKFSYQWIAELAPGLKIQARDLERLITMKTAECEGVEEIGTLLHDACLARVMAVAEIPGTHLTKATVDIGSAGFKTVVCGADNCVPGMITAYAPIGVKVVQGVASDGMLASGQDLSVNQDHAGILTLAGEPGERLAGCTPDSVIEIDNKSLTHRPDLWGHYGMAREVAAIASCTLRDPVDLSLLPEGPAPVKIEIADTELCPRYSAVVFENVTVAQSPLWLQYRLTAVGLKPINNIVDLTNFVLAELAQPMHAFDLDRLHGDTIYARPARDGEQLRALNDETYALTAANLIIADASGPIALAGVIGGDASAISDSTKRIVFESANFQASSVRRTSSTLKIRTDASMRFEKAQDPVNTTRALARVIALMREVCPGATLSGGTADAGKPIDQPAPVLLRLAWLAKKLGRELSASEVRRILESLQFGVTDAEPGVFSVGIPSWRATKDISTPDDLVEEVGRMIGYESIEPRPPLVAAVVPPDSRERIYLRQLRAMLAARGFIEVSNYSFLSEHHALQFGLRAEDHLRLLNPIVAGQDLMRLSLVPGIVANIAANRKHFENFQLFEIGREIHRQPAGLPDERIHLVAAIFARHGDGRAGLLTLKSSVEAMLQGASLRPAPARSYEHPARTAEVIWHSAVVARLFELHPSFGEGRAAIVDLDLGAIEKLKPATGQYTPVQRYPSSHFDLSVLAPERALAGDLENQLRSFSGPLLEHIAYVREYAGPPLAAGLKSVSYRLTLSASEHTLSSDEVTAVRNAIIDGMRNLGYDLRV
jgi:phenylalanyl-tRNA synthetase beta chain